MALERAQGDFWESKPGLKLQRDRVEKTFAEFINRVQAGAIGERGIKRFHKLPETLKVLHPGPASGGEGTRIRFTALPNSAAQP